MKSIHSLASHIRKHVVSQVREKTGAVVGLTKADETDIDRSLAAELQKEADMAGVKVTAQDIADAIKLKKAQESGGDSGLSPERAQQIMALGSAIVEAEMAGLLKAVKGSESAAAGDPVDPESLEAAE